MFNKFNFEFCFNEKVASERFEMERAGGERERLLMKSRTRRDQSLLQSPIQFTVAFFCKLNKAIEKIYWRHLREAVKNFLADFVR